MRIYMVHYTYKGKKHKIEVLARSTNHAIETVQSKAADGVRIYRVDV